jgi:hypothetical protein
VTSLGGQFLVWSFELSTSDIRHVLLTYYTAGKRLGVSRCWCSQGRDGATRLRCVGRLILDGTVQRKDPFDRHQEQNGKQ